MREQMNLFKDCKSPCMVFAEITNLYKGDPKTPLSKKPKACQRMNGNYFSRINEIRKMMLDEGMPLAYHHHMGTVIETTETRRLNRKYKR